MGILSKLKTRLLGSPTKLPQKKEEPLKYKPTSNLKVIRATMNSVIEELQKRIKKDGPTQQSLRMFAAMWGVKNAFNLIRDLDQMDWKPVPHHTMSLSIYTGENGDGFFDVKIKKLLKQSEEEDVDRGTKKRVREKNSTDTPVSGQNGLPAGASRMHVDKNRRNDSGHRGDVRKEKRVSRRAAGDSLNKRIAKGNSATRRFKNFREERRRQKIRQRLAQKKRR